MSFDKALEHVILNIEKEANAFDISLKSELGGILDEILYDDLIDAHYDKDPSRLVLPGWLLDNLHNPYPSRSTRTHLATLAHSSLKQLDVWFSNARSRIGWTSIVKRYFRGSKHIAIDFASAVFSSFDGQKTLKTPVLTDIPDEIVHSFLSMRSKAREFVFLRNKKDDEMAAWNLIKYAEESALHTDTNRLPTFSSVSPHVHTVSEAARKNTATCFPQTITHISYANISDSVLAKGDDVRISKRKRDFEEGNLFKKSRNVYERPLEEYVRDCQKIPSTSVFHLVTPQKRTCITTLEERDPSNSSLGSFKIEERARKRQRRTPRLITYQDNEFFEISSRLFALHPTVVTFTPMPLLPLFSFVPYPNFDSLINGIPTIQEDSQISQGLVDTYNPKVDGYKFPAAWSVGDNENIVTRAFDVSDLSLTSCYPTESGHSVDTDSLGHYGMIGNTDNNNSKDTDAYAAVTNNNATANIKCSEPNSEQLPIISPLMDNFLSGYTSLALTPETLTLLDGDASVPMYLFNKNNNAITNTANSFGGENSVLDHDTDAEWTFDKRWSGKRKLSLRGDTYTSKDSVPTLFSASKSTGLNEKRAKKRKFSAENKDLPSTKVVRTNGTKVVSVT